MNPQEKPTSQEAQAEKPFEDAANELLAKAAQSHPETTESFALADSHVDALLAAADAGEITGSAGTYSREQLLRQFGDFLHELNRPESERTVADAYSYIPGKGGLRSSFRAIMENPATQRNFSDSLKLHIEAHEKKRAELLSPDKIEGMGEVEVEAAGIKDPMDEAKRAAGGMIDVPDWVRNSGAPQEVAAEARADISAEPGASEQAPVSLEQETDLQMNERFLRESQAELQDLYAQHRQVAPGSYEAGTLENQIKYAKEDVGKFARKVSSLKGNSNWT